MIRHLTVRVAWHDSQWNGAVCAAPSRNSYCPALERIREQRNDALEDGLAGHAWGSLSHEELPPCIGEGGGFMNAHEWTRTFEHPYHKISAAKSTHGDLRTTRVRVAPYTTFAVPFAWMLAKNQPTIDATLPQPLPDDDPAPFKSAWVFGRTRQEALSKQFFDQFSPRQSLVFFYCKEGQPLGDHLSRLVVGVGRILSIGPLRHYESFTDKTFPFWDREIHHSIRPDGADGFLLPYHAYLATTGDPMEDARRRALLEEIAITVDPAHQRTFSFAAEHATPDVALATLTRCLDAVRLVRRHGIAKGPWDEREHWLNDQIASAWRDRGAFPGLGSALQALGLRMGTTFAYDLIQSGALKPDDEPWPLIDAILRGERPAPSARYEPHLKPLRPVWSRLSDDRRALLCLLARFDLAPEQASRWFNEDQRRKAAAPFITDSDILANPYRMAEVDLGDASAPAVTVEVIDRGVFPPDSITSRFPLPEPSAIDDEHDMRRVRSALVDVLREAADEGDTLLGRDEALARIQKLRLARPCAIGPDWLVAYREQLAPAVTLFGTPSGMDEQSSVSVVQLSEVYAREETVRNITAARAKAPLPSLGADWQSLLREAIGAHYDATNERHREALEEQATALERITTRKLSVLTGRAGTGKTSVMGALLGATRLREDGVLLLAPTGKARVRLAKAVGSDVLAQTIAQFLYALGRYDGERQRPLFLGKQGKQYQRERTIVIDECSMLTLDLLAAVLDALDLSHVQRIILVGDPNQLPPIGAGRPFADMVAYLDGQEDAGVTPSVAYALGRLTVEVRTQTANSVSDTLRLASWFTAGAQSVDADRVFSETLTGASFNDLDIAFWTTPEELRERILEKMQAHLGLSHPADVEGFNRALGISDKGLVAFDQPDTIEHFQLLTPTRMQPHGTYDLNRWFQRRFRAKELHTAHQFNGVRLGPEDIVRLDKVIQVQNRQQDMYDWRHKQSFKSYLANGEIGVVATTKKPHLNVLFAGHPQVTAGYWEGNYRETNAPIELAYALTAHKAQGSEFDIVFVVIPETTKLLSRELLYTCLTRARTRLVLLVQGENALRLHDYSLPGESVTARRNSNLFVAAVRQPASDRPFAEHLIHRTRDGRLVRSKSELVISNMLEDMNVPYDYEKVLPGTVAAGWRYPDFTFTDPAGERLIWEHLGMLSQPAYAQGWEDKRQWYAQNGYIEGHNLFTTADDKHGGLDSTSVERTAKQIAALL